jgi:hypothetical protein
MAPALLLLYAPALLLLVSLTASLTARLLSLVDDHIASGSAGITEQQQGCGTAHTLVAVRSCPFSGWQSHHERHNCERARLPNSVHLTPAASSATLHIPDRGRSAKLL